MTVAPTPTKAQADARWAYVLARVEAIQKLQATGHLVLDTQDNEIVGPLVIEGKEVYEQSNDHTKYRWYEHDPDWDHGYYWTIEEIEQKLFSSLRAYSPVPIKV